MENVQWKVEGMDCSSCALTIHKYLEKQGMKNVKVNFATGDVIFDAQAAMEDTILTHPNPLVSQIAICYCIAIQKLLKLQKTEDAFQSA